jgi:hypothetical protein
MLDAVCKYLPSQWTKGIEEFILMMQLLEDQVKFYVSQTLKSPSLL